MDLATVDQLLTTTRAVRRRLDLTRHVPAEVITDCVRLATQAPSAGDLQNWRWVAVTDSDRRAALAGIYRAATEEYIRAELEKSSDDVRRRLGSALYLMEHLHEVPVHVLTYVFEVDGIPTPVLYGSIYPAVWSFQLALRSRGLGSTPLYVPAEAEIAAVVGAPATARLAALLPVAYYTGDSFRPAERRPVEEVLSWDQF
jgi:nitroreductase